MSKTGRPNYRRSGRELRHRPKGERHIYVRVVRRDPPDVDLLAKAFLALALADAARDAKETDGREAANDNPAHASQEVRHDD